MANGYDGEITLGVKLSPSDVKKSAQALQKEIEKIFETSAGKSTDAKFDKMKSQLDKNSAKAQELVKNLEKLENTKVPSQTYKDLQKELQLLNKEWNSLIKQQEKFSDKHVAVPPDLVSSLERVETEISVVKGEMASLTDEEKYAFDSSKIEAVKNRLNDTNNTTRMLIQSTRAYGNELERTSQVSPKRDVSFISEEPDSDLYDLTNVSLSTDSIITKLEMSFRRLGESGQIALGQLYDVIQDVGGGLKNLVVNGMSPLISETMKLASGTILTPFTKLSSSILGLGKSSESAGISVKKLLMTFLRYGLGIRSLFFLFRKLRSAIQEGFNNLQQFNGGSNEVASTINSLQASLTSLKNAWAAAFAPILQFVAPILQTLINMLITAANAIATFFAALGGQSKVIKATKNQEALGSAIGGTGAAADKAKGQLAAFDELNLLDQDSGGGGGGGGGAGGGLGFEYDDIGDQFKDLAELFKKSWENADFTEIGAMVGNAIKDALDKAYDYLTGPIKDFCERLAKSLATFLNGMIEVEGLGTSIGKVLAAVLNDGFLFVNTFLKTFHWGSLGRLIGESLQAAIVEFDWGNISTFIIGRIIAIMQFITGFVTGIDWSEVPRIVWDSIVEFVQGIDVAGLVGSVTALVASISSALINLGIGLVKLLWEIGKNVFEGFIEGGLTIISNIKQWLYDNLLKPFWDAIVDFFVIGSPSKLMEDIGIDIMQGLLNGIKSLVNAVIEVWNKLKDKIIEIFKNLHNKIKEVWTSIKTTISTLVTNVKDTAVNIFNSIRDTLSGIVDTIRNKVTGAFGAISDFASSVFSGMSTAVVNCFRGMWNGIRGFINSILSGVESMANGVVNGINALISALNSVNFSIPDWVPVLGGKSFGLHLGYVGGVSLPRLAQGAVIPPNKEFMAVLGDQSSGTNIEAPLETIKDAVREVNENNDQLMVELLQELIETVRTKNLTISKRDIGDSAIEEINSRTKRTGRTPILG